MPSKDYYKILQVDPAAEPEVIAAAYRRLSLKYHPDTNAAADATARMQDINEAYEVLKEPAKRARYDRERRVRSSSLAQDEEWRRGAEAEPRTEERRRAEYERQQKETAGTTRGHGAEAAESTIPAFRSIPRGARAVKAFSREPVYCEGNLFQEHTVPSSGWLDLGFEWVARELTTLLTTWPFLALAVTVDGQGIDNPMRQSRGPDEVILPCGRETRFGYVMADSLYIPPLPPGDHTIIWTIGFPRDVDSGWQTYLRGTELVITSLLHVVKAV